MTVGDHDDLPQVRDATGFVLAEERLQIMGFKVLTDGRIKEYVEETDGYAVWADPRAAGRIDFKVYRITTKIHKKKGPVAAKKYLGAFHFHDTIKNELVDRYRNRRDTLLGP